MCLSVDTKTPEPQGVGQTELQGSVAVSDDGCTILRIWDRMLTSIGMPGIFFYA